MFYRKISSFISNYLDEQNQEVLCIDGARQIGKSFIIREVCSKKYKNYVEVDLAEDKIGNRLFEKVNTIDQFYIQLSLKFGNVLGSREDTIIFLDEIQEYPNLLSLLKALRKDNRFEYICSGSLLGVTLADSPFIPMGSIYEKRMFPMDFEEFLYANGVGVELINHLKKSFVNKQSIDKSTHDYLINLFKMYLIVGGWPAAVKIYVNEKNILKVRNIQTEIQKLYVKDAAKYDKEKKLNINRIYSLISSTISSKVSRIKISDIDNKKANFSKYEEDFEYLLSSGIALGVNAVSEPKYPLIQSVKKNLIKLYYNDIGILTNILFKNNINVILEDRKKVNLGSVYETVVACELLSHGHELYYYDNKKMGEVDYLINDYDNVSILPIEVKSGRDIYEYRALPKIVKNDNYNIKTGYIFDNLEGITQKEDNIFRFPIYYIMFI